MFADRPKPACAGDPIKYIAAVIVLLSFLVTSGDNNLLNRVAALMPQDPGGASAVAASRHR